MEGLSMEKVVRALRIRWWWIAITAVLLPLLTAVALFFVSPTYEAVGVLRIDQDSPGFRGLEALELLDVFTGGGASIPTEIAILRSRSLALRIDDELALRPVMERPRGLRRSLLFETLRAEEGSPEAELTFVYSGASYRVEAKVRRSLEQWRPFGGKTWVELAPIEVRPGEPFEVAGVIGQLRADAPERATEIRVKVADEEKFLRDHEEALSVDRSEREADIIEIRFQGNDPEIARDAVNRLAEIYVEERRETMATTSSATAGFLAGEISSVREEIEGAEEEFRLFRERNRMVAPVAEAEGEILRMAEQQGHLELIQAEEEAIGSLLSEILAEIEDPGSVPATPSPWRRLVAFPTLLANPASAELLSQLGELDTQYSALMETRTEGDPAARLLAERIRAIELQLREIAETYLRGLSAQATSLDRALLASRTELEQLPAVDIEFFRLQRQVELLGEVFAVLELRRREAEIHAVIEDMSVHIVDSALLPQKPISPRPLVSLSLSLLVGILLGGIGAVLREGI